MNHAETYASGLEATAENIHAVARELGALAVRIRAGQVPPGKAKIALALGERFGEHLYRGQQAITELTELLAG